MTTNKKLSVWAPTTQGASLTMQAQCDTIAEARLTASKFERRLDLRHQDVEIRLGYDGRRIEFAGPVH